MSHNNSLLFLKNNINFFLNTLKTPKSLQFFLITVILFFLSCSAAKRFPEKDEKDRKNEKEIVKTEKILTAELNFSEVRVLLKGLVPAESLTIDSPVYLFNNGNKIALIKSGNTIECNNNSEELSLTVNAKSYNGDIFFISSTENDNLVRVNGKRFRGKIQISSSGNSIDVINVVGIEDYVKGVLAKEMPVGKNGEYFEALKALAVCVRTYAAQKIKDGKIYFDLYADTRDQVYGGVDAESALSNEAADETRNLILKFNGSQALIFYHSTCGGFTESSQNVFTKENIPYLTSIEDGSEPYCKISPRFEWTETYSNELIINRLKNYSLIDDLNYST